MSVTVCEWYVGILIALSVNPHNAADKPHSFMFSIAVIISWFVDKKIAERALRAHQLIEEDQVECRPERIPAAVVDENVDVHLVRRHFSSDAWVLIESVVKQKAKMKWTCQTCYHDLHTEQSILCDSCLLWFHFRCVGLTRQPKTRNWFCRSCFAASK